MAIFEATYEESNRFYDKYYKICTILEAFGYNYFKIKKKSSFTLVSCRCACLNPILQYALVYPSEQFCILVECIDRLLSSINCSQHYFIFYCLCLDDFFSCVVYYLYHSRWNTCVYASFGCKFTIYGNG